MRRWPKAAMGQSPAGLFGFSHMMGGYAGGQAEYLRVPYADVAPIKIPDGIPDEKVLFLSDIFPTGYMAAENCGIEPGDTVAVWGCGPVGQFAMQSAWMLGAGRVIAIDRVPERLRMAEQHGKAETINFDDVKVYDRLMEMTNGRGPDRCIDAVGAEAHGSGSFDAIVDKAKAAVMLGDGSAARPSRSDHVLPKGRHHLGPGRLHRPARQDPVRRRDEQGHHVQDGPDARAALHEAAAGEDRIGRDRSVVRHHPSRPARRRPGGLQDVPRQGRWLHQGGAQAVSPDGPTPIIVSGEPSPETRVRPKRWQEMIKYEIRDCDNDRAFD